MGAFVDAFRSKRVGLCIPLGFAAGLAGGFAYWAVAGWSAGFWKPVFRQRVLAPPARDPFNPPAPTGA